MHEIFDNEDDAEEFKRKRGEKEGGRKRQGRRYLKIRVGPLVSKPVVTVWPVGPITNLGHDTWWL